MVHVQPFYFTDEEAEVPGKKEIFFFFFKFIVELDQITTLPGHCFHT